MATGTADGSASYDGFMSYSHAADDLLAPRLQSALQRFAKPWWQRRAVRIFRDESSLSANPHLWSSITEALDSSSWFVLLLSPDAAQSEWVNQEISYWVENRDPKRILPVVTGGDFMWANGDVAGEAVPYALRGVFEEEPRWVDLRFAREEEQLDLKHPEFNSAIADIASTIRGIPKDELASEEVRQHRRTVRTAWVAGALVVGLAVASVGFGIAALRNAGEAARQRQVAVDNAAEADRQRLVADQRAAEAIGQAQNSEARRLAAEAASVSGDDVQLSLLLLLEALETASDADLQQELIRSLREAAGENRLIARYDVPTWSGRVFDDGSPRNHPFANRAVLSPDGSVIYHASRETHTFQAIAVEDGSTRWEWSAGQGEELAFVSVSPDGDLIALSVFGPVGSAGRVVVFDTRTREQKAEIRSQGCRVIAPAGGGFSADGDWFSVLDGSADCVASRDDNWATVYDTSTWQEVLRHVEPGARSERMLIAADTALIAFLSDQGVQSARLVTFPALEPLVEFGARWPSVSPDGRTVVHTGRNPTWPQTSPFPSVALVRRSVPGFDVPLRIAHRFAAVRGEETTDGLQLDRAISPFAFSRDGSLLAIASEESDVVLNLRDGAVVLRLYETGDTFDISWSEDGTRLLTSHEDELLLWSSEPIPIPNDVRASRDWMGYATELLVRGFTVAECFEFDIEPCPTLEEMEAR